MEDSDSEPKLAPMPEGDRVPVHLIETYQRLVRGVLEAHSPENLAMVDQAVENLTAALKVPCRVKVGLVGESQVGKSTLLNAMIGRQLLPSGGIGPMTAQSILVTHGESLRVVVAYHKPEKLNQLRAALEFSLAARRSHQKEPRSNVEADQVLDSEDQDDRRSLESQARALLATGSETPVDQIIEALALAASESDKFQARLGSSTLPESLKQQALLIREKAKLGKKLTAKAPAESEKNTEFRQFLSDNATGWLAPLVKSMELSVPVDLVRDLDLVDLPGIGTVDDEAQRLTKQFLDTADGLLLVTLNNGVTEAHARLLDEKGLISRMLWHADRSRPPFHFMVVVTHLDDVASGKFDQLSEAAAENGDPEPRREDVFREAAVEMESVVRRQLGEVLRNSRAYQATEGMTREGREAAVVALVNSMKVFCVSARDHLRLIRGLKTQLFLTDQATTGLSELERAIREVGTRQLDARASMVNACAAELSDAIRRTLDVIQTAHTDGRERLGRWERFRDQLQEARQALTGEMKARHGEFLGTLQSAIPERINGLVARVQVGAQKQFGNSLSRAQDLYWSSLNAAITRGGVWPRRGVDLPGEVTRSVIDGVASRWESEVVSEMRNRFTALVAADRTLVNRFRKAASDAATNGSGSQTDVEEVFRPIDAILSSRSETIGTWGTGAISGLTERVRTRIASVVEEVIERKCMAAVMEGSNRGAGAKQRIIAAFQKSCEAAIESACRSAQELLQREYSVLRGQFGEKFLQGYGSPIDQAYTMLVGDQEKQKSIRSDAERSRKVIEAVTRARNSVDSVLECAD